MKIMRSYKFKLSPTDEQKRLLVIHGENCRWLWNHFLELNKSRYAETGKFIFANELSSLLPNMKASRDWLRRTSAQSLQQVSRHLDSALRNSFGGKYGFPKFKKKSARRDSFTVPQKFRISKGYIFIPKVGEVPWVKHRAIKGTVKHVTIKQRGGQWHCSVCAELRVRAINKKNDSPEIIGIDVGLKNYATLSNGSVIDNPRILEKYRKKLARASRRLSRKAKGGKNREKSRLALSKLYRKISDSRHDFHHKTTSGMINKCGGFVMENLNIMGMLKNHSLAKSISDAGWYEFKRQLRYKSEWSSLPFIEIGRFEATSKICCCCGWRDDGLSLSDRQFKCESCGNAMDRDRNAAINIKNIGLNSVPWDARERGGSAAKTLEDDERFMPQGRCSSLSQEKECLGLNCESLLNQAEANGIVLRSVTGHKNPSE